MDLRLPPPHFCFCTRAQPHVALRSLAGKEGCEWLRRTVGLLAGFPTMQTTINTLLPKLVPLMQKANPGVLGPIDM